LGQPLKLKIELPNPAATELFAQQLAAALPGDATGWMILLQGELGAGKSSVARAMLHALGHTGTVPSPTYTLVEPYKLAHYSVYHIDLYRIASGDELEFLGWSDLHDGLMLVEWPERVAGLEKDADVRVALSYAGDGRVVELSALSDRGQAILSGISPGSVLS
jgi:tRNA threonylcarbamoyladenosine biosynthesis protein TsaE